jgi:alpha-tubulin suppressor-like RCC1 family protein
MRPLRGWLLALTLLSALPLEGHGAAGEVVVWGYGEGIVMTNVPPGLTNVVAVSAGLNQALALRDDGTVVAWGTDSGWRETHVPPGLSNVVAISAGWLFNMALRGDGTVVTWGPPETVPPAGLTNVVAISAGGHQFCLALRADKTVVARGWNGSGQTNVPPDLTNVVAVAGGLDHSAALRGDGTVVAWGTNDFFGNLSIPAGLSNVVAISAGWSQTLALRSDGTVVGWGFDAHVPAGLSNVVMVACGWDAGRTFLRIDGNLVFGVPGMSNVVRVARGHFFVVAVVVPVEPALAAAITPERADWEAGCFSVSAPTRFGRVYSLQYKDALDTSNWMSLPLLSGNGEAQTLRDDGATVPHRFYRLLQW